VKVSIGFLTMLAIVLAGCSGAAATREGVPATVTRTIVPSATAPSPVGSTDGETRTDEQGAVIFEVTPLTLDSPGDTLDFEVVMNTHSIDLGWDLAAQSVLQTDTGLEVRGTSWPVGNGHHYGGTLSFPAVTNDGENLLEGVGMLTLVIRGTDVPERLFVWELGS
jgi:hypothetical protein